MNMLMIGNSATDDTVEYIYNILENLGEDVSKINIYVLFFGAVPLINTMISTITITQTMI